MVEENSVPIPYKALANAMSENYESVYVIDPLTGSYNVYFASSSYQDLDLAASGPDFFAALEHAVERVIAPDDQASVMRMLSKEALLAGVQEGGVHTLVYRIQQDGRPVYHQIRAVLDEADGRQHVLIGVRNVDESMRQTRRREEELDAERQKSASYRGALLATAAAYTYANLTADLVIEHAPNRQGRMEPLLQVIPSPEEEPSYSAFQTWVCENIICENEDDYRRTSSRENLLACFERGAGRESVSFSVAAADEDPVPCRAVFHLYRERASGDVCSLCVIYDLTAQQRVEQELDELRTALDMSRIHTSSSQMQPHFLYNALGSIQEIMLDDPTTAAGLLEDFTVHLRGLIKAMDGDEPIPFDRELDAIRAYVRIEAMRLGERLEMRYELDGTDFSVVPLSIQPLVENAIRHGIHKRGRQGGTVTLRTWPEASAWVVQVEDTGVGFDAGAYEHAVVHGDTESTGIKNTRFRLEKIMGAHVDVRTAPQTGTVVTVRIPREGGAL